MGCRDDWGQEPEQLKYCDNCGGLHYRQYYPNQIECIRSLRAQIDRLHATVYKDINK